MQGRKQLKRCSLPCTAKPDVTEVTRAFAMQRKEIVEPPKPMFPYLNFEDTKLSINNGYHSFTALLFLMVLGTNTFEEIFRAMNSKEVELNIIKRHARVFIEEFREEGVFDVEQLNHLLTKCNDEGRRSERTVERTLDLGVDAPSNDVGKGYFYKSRQVDAPSNEQPHAEEIMRNFQRNFDRLGAEFTSVRLPEEMHMTVQEFCDKEKLVVNSPCITFVRPDGWVADNKATIFPNKEITVFGSKYVLKGAMLRKGSEEVTYDAHLFDGDDVFTYSSKYSGTRQTECFSEGCETDTIFGSEELYRDYKLSTCLSESYLELVTGLVKDTDMLLYVKVNTPIAKEEVRSESSIQE
ncbi:hypothetical protein COB11_06125 [Candidatus Aerophobetes bacterium]|uniref:Uncharacterized protein n=1 Tax=Aerophobetes bacterium TaxID=2030807 RepID=A0A2A4YEV9_UNCAE|nr:MAG: hypothetical protein COB11_06125 [Candidatus Aerophobetes bacterium]